jgi:hypothetical protein
MLQNWNLIVDDTLLFSVMIELKCFVRKSCTGKSEGVATNLGQSGSQSTSCGTFVFEKHIKMSEASGYCLYFGNQG